MYKFWFMIYCSICMTSVLHITFLNISIFRIYCINLHRRTSYAIIFTESLPTIRVMSLLNIWTSLLCIENLHCTLQIKPSTLVSSRGSSPRKSPTSAFSVFLTSYFISFEELLLYMCKTAFMDTMTNWLI